VSPVKYELGFYISEDDILQNDSSSGRDSGKVPSYNKSETV
jgi:hypothetical protein